MNGKSRTTALAIWASIIFPFSIIGFGTACAFDDLAVDVYVENRGSVTVEVCTVELSTSEATSPEYCDDFIVGAGQTKRTFKVLKEGRRSSLADLVRIRAIDGSLLDERRFTWFQMRDQDFTILVTEDGIVPPEPETKSNIPP